MLFQIRNTGPSSASDLEVAVYWPATDEQGRKLLVLNQDKPFMSEHQGTCMVKESVSIIISQYKPFMPEYQGTCVVKESVSIINISI